MMPSECQRKTSSAVAVAGSSVDAALSPQESYSCQFSSKDNKKKCRPHKRMGGGNTASTGSLSTLGGGAAAAKKNPPPSIVSTASSKSSATGPLPLKTANTTSPAVIAPSPSQADAVAVANKQQQNGNGNNGAANLSKVIRQLVWNKYIGERNGTGKCWCCRGKTISAFEFEAGHVVSRAHGGEDTVDNLRPICSLCNKSMGKENMFEYQKRQKLGPSTSAQIYEGIVGFLSYIPLRFGW